MFTGIVEETGILRSLRPAPGGGGILTARCRAVLDAIPNLGFDVDVVHCNDWHTAMIPMLARTQYRGAKQEQIKYLLTIHNIAFQGKFGFDFVQDMLGVDSRY